MSDQYTETTSTSWFRRITGAFGGIGAGFILVIVACVALFWNEGRAVKTERTLDEGSGAVVSVDAMRPDPANNGQLVHISGPIKVDAAPTDPLFSGLSLPINTIGIARQVEMYQWKQESTRETRNKIGGGTQKVTVYSYVKEWSSHRIDSSNFKKLEGHSNPEFAVPQNRAASKSASIGGFHFKGSTLADLGTTEKLPLDDAALGGVKRFLGDSYHVENSAGAIYVGVNPAAPAVGDLKITLTAFVAGDASVIGMQKDGSVQSYKASNGNTIFLTNAGNKSASEMFDSAKGANATMTWIIRGVGTLAILIGFRLMFSIIGVLGDVVPFIGDVFRFATGLASLALTFMIAPLVIGIAWIAYRPILGATILITGVLIAAGFLFIGRSRAATAKSEAFIQSPAPRV